VFSSSLAGIEAYKTEIHRPIFNNQHQVPVTLQCVVCVCSIDEQQERCRSRAVSSCDASTRDRINASYTAIHREWSKICYPSPPSALTLDAGIGALSPCLWLHSLKIIGDIGSYFQICNAKSTIFSALGLLRSACENSCSNITITKCFAIFGKHWVSVINRNWESWGERAQTYSDIVIIFAWTYTQWTIKNVTFYFSL